MFAWVNRGREKKKSGTVEVKGCQPSCTEKTRGLAPSNPFTSTKWGGENWRQEVKRADSCQRKTMEVKPCPNPSGKEGTATGRDPRQHWLKIHKRKAKKSG